MQVRSSYKDTWHHLWAWCVCMSASVLCLGVLQRLVLPKPARCRATACRSPVLQNQAAPKAPRRCSAARLRELEKSRAPAVTRILENQVISLLRSVIVLHWGRCSYTDAQEPLLYPPFVLRVALPAVTLDVTLETRNAENNMIHFT